MLRPSCSIIPGYAELSNDSLPNHTENRPAAGNGQILTEVGKENSSAAFGKSQGFLVWWERPQGGFRVKCSQANGIYRHRRGAAGDCSPMKRRQRPHTIRIEGLSFSLPRAILKDHRQMKSDPKQRS